MNYFGEVFEAYSTEHWDGGIIHLVRVREYRTPGYPPGEKASAKVEGSDQYLQPDDWFPTEEEAREAVAESLRVFIKELERNATGIEVIDQR